MHSYSQHIHFKKGIQHERGDDSLNYYSNENNLSFPGFGIRVHHPELSDMENHKRKNILRDASENLLKDFGKKKNGREETTWH